MKAFIFNSGTGSRMGDLTKTNPKALVYLSNGETILGRQIRLLKKAGIKNITISTGPLESQIIEHTKKFGEINFQFINNPLYKETNSIYSLYLAKDLIDDDVIMMHGDLVFDSLILDELINSKSKDVCLINPLISQPKKDFKGRIIDHKLREISVNIFDSNCYALQPLYKFSVDTVNHWFREIDSFVRDGNISVYAESALNNILDNANVTYLDYSSHYIEEIDNLEDLTKVSTTFRFEDYKNQKVLITNKYIEEIKLFVSKYNLKNPLIVHGKHLLKDFQFNNFKVNSKFHAFTEYSPNPAYQEVLNGLAIFKNNLCDSIIAIGGGSCIDVAKAIKLYSVYETDFINQKVMYVDLPMMAIPTTAGTGTESTRYSVIYYEGEKQSLANDSLLPDYAVLNDEFLYDIPEYHKKSALLDAFCQAIESFWSINSNEQSKKHSENALKLILNNYEQYLSSNQKVYNDILLAANYAGKAINISQTTAPHAMSYKVSSIKGIAHGHAVSLILPYVLDFMIHNFDLSQDPRGLVYVKKTFESLCTIFKVNSLENLVKRIIDVISHFKLEIPEVSLEEIDVFSASVNPVRLKNSPIYICEKTAKEIYINSFYSVK